MRHLRAAWRLRDVRATSGPEGPWQPVDGREQVLVGEVTPEERTSTTTAPSRPGNPTCRGSSAGKSASTARGRATAVPREELMHYHLTVEYERNVALVTDAEETRLDVVHYGTPVARLTKRMSRPRKIRARPRRRSSALPPAPVRAARRGGYLVFGLEEMPADPGPPPASRPVPWPTQSRPSLPSGNPPRHEQ